MPATKKTANPNADLEDLGAQFREAKAGLVDLRNREVAADLKRMDWLRRHRTLPAHVLYDRKTGDPIHPELIDHEKALAKATSDLLWCKGLVIACGEAYKGESFETIVARNAAQRHRKGRAS